GASEGEAEGVEGLPGRVGRGEASLDEGEPAAGLAEEAGGGGAAAPGAAGAAVARGRGGGDHEHGGWVERETPWDRPYGGAGPVMGMVPHVSPLLHPSRNSECPGVAALGQNNE